VATLRRPLLFRGASFLLTHVRSDEISGEFRPDAGFLLLLEYPVARDEGFDFFGLLIPSEGIVAEGR
jgi:hypothetical protein